MNTIYYSIQSYSSFNRCCDEWKAICPDCGTDLCVFCEAECPGCNAPLF